MSCNGFLRQQGGLRRRTPGLWLTCVALLSTTAGLSSRSRGEEPEDARAKAVRLTSEGAAAYKQEEYVQAIDKFGAAYKLYAAPPLLLNLSRAELKMNRCNEALHDAELFKAAVPQAEGVSPDSPEAWLTTVQRSCIEAAVQSTPPGATIWIDGERQASPDTTPWTGRLPVGSHKVLLWRDGYQEVKAYLDVSADAPAHLELTMIPVAAGTTPPPPPLAPTPKVEAVQLTPPVSASREPMSAVKANANPTLRNVGYAGIAVGGAALLVAVILGVTSHNDSMAALDKKSGARTLGQVNAQVSSVDGLAAGADALYGIGGCLAVGGVALAVVF